MRFEILRHVLILYCLIAQVSAVVQETRSITFPADLETLCPHTSFCNHDKGEIGPASGESVIPCCTSCSCAKDCGRRRNCCKYEYDQYKLDETLGTTCKPLTFPFHRADNEPYYHIVYRCPNSSERCHTKNIPSWGAFYPVYSLQSEMLYYNPYCANCHDQANITAFDPFVKCPSVWRSYFTSAIMLKKGVKDSECLLRFIPPPHLDLSHEMCHPSISRNCWLKDSYNYDTYNKLCKSYNATFLTNSLGAYGNVYCFLCNLANFYGDYDYFLNEHQFCEALRVERSDTTHASISILLDKSFNYDSDVQPPTGNDRKWCTLERGEEMCRPLFCPEGQTHFDGDCRPIGSSWYFKHVGIGFQLETPPGANRVNLVDIFSQASFSEATSVKSPTLERPGFEDWDLSLLYNTHSDNSTVNYFIALLFHKRKTIVPKIFIQKTISALNGKWKLQINGLSFKLNPRLSKYLNYVSPKNNSDFIPIWYQYSREIDDEAYQNRDKDIAKVLIGDKILKHSNRAELIFLSKVNFCTLIEIGDREFVYSEFRIYLKDRDKFLEDGEFMVVKAEYDIIRICLEDFQQGDAWNIARSSFFCKLFVSFLFSFRFHGY